MLRFVSFAEQKEVGSLNSPWRPEPSQIFMPSSLFAANASFYAFASSSSKLKPINRFKKQLGSRQVVQWKVQKSEIPSDLQHWQALWRMQRWKILDQTVSTGVTLGQETLLLPHDWNKWQYPLTLWILSRRHWLVSRLRQWTWETQ